MKRTQVIIKQRRRVRDRDAELRLAHRQAFQKMQDAGSSPARHRLIAKAVQELIDACENYVETTP